MPRCGCALCLGTFPAADPSGRFYARVAQAIARGAGLCAKARSGVIRVST